MLNKNIKYLIRKDKGQATVEAAIMIPIIFLILLLLIEPSILLYDFCIMNSSASETCRILSTCNELDKVNVCETYAKKRLSAIPQQDNFHLHSSGCSYEITLIGNENSEECEVKIKNEIVPLPLIGFLSDIVGILNNNKNFELIASANYKSRPSWVKNNLKDLTTENWVGKWLDN